MDRAKINSVGELLPEGAVKTIEEGLEWIKHHPAEAIIAGTAGGFLLGLTGFGQVYRGIRSLQAMPLVSQFLLSVVTNGLGSNDSNNPLDSIH